LPPDEDDSERLGGLGLGGLRLGGKRRRDGLEMAQAMERGRKKIFLYIFFPGNFKITLVFADFVIQTSLKSCEIF
jgi:hypothetical protein